MSKIKNKTRKVQFVIYAPEQIKSEIFNIKDVEKLNDDSLKLNDFEPPTYKINAELNLPNDIDYIFAKDYIEWLLKSENIQYYEIIIEFFVESANLI